MKSSSKRSKIVIVILIVTVLISVIAWTRLNIQGMQQGFDPEVAHLFSKRFQYECRRDVGDRELCKKIHGINHRRCFTEHLQHEDPDDPKSPYVYSQRDYLKCMNDAAKVIIDAE